MKPYVTNASDEQQVRDAGSREKRARDTELDDVRSVLSTPQGRRFVWRYLGECRVFTTSFNNSGSITAFNEGSRNIGLKLLADVNEANPDAYAVMTKESKND